MSMGSSNQVPADRGHWGDRSALNALRRALLLAFVSHMPRGRESFGLEWRPQALRGDGFPFGLDLKQAGAFHL